MNWLTVESDKFYTLGIYHNNEYNKCIEKNWEVIIGKIKNHLNSILKRKLSLHQRVIYANSCLLSKVWYIVHTYPLNKTYAKEINKLVFQYVWGGRYEPIKRNTICRPKKEGGLGMINCLAKANTIMINTFLKSYTYEEYRNVLMYHYCFIRLSNILPSNFSIHHASPWTPVYYDIAITEMRGIIHLSRFPNAPKRKIYMSMLPKEQSLAEHLYPTLNWNNIWDNFNVLPMFSYDKEILYKHLHMVLATNKRLFSMNLSNTDKCNRCTTDREQTPLHLFYECDLVKPLFMWLLKILYYVSNYTPISNIKVIYLDNKYSTIEQKKICNLFISIYILTVWRNRKENLRIGIMKRRVISKVIQTINTVKQMQNISREKNIGNCLDRIDLMDLITK